MYMSVYKSISKWVEFSFIPLLLLPSLPLLKYQIFIFIATSYLRSITHSFAWKRIQKLKNAFAHYVVVISCGDACNLLYICTYVTSIVAATLNSTTHTDRMNVFTQTNGKTSLTNLTMKVLMAVRETVATKGRQQAVVPTHLAANEP